MSGVPIVPGLSVSAVDSDVVLLTAMDSSVPGGAQTGYRIDAGYSADDGHLIWGPINRTLEAFTNRPLGPAGEGVYTEYTCQSMTWTGYSIETGDKLWGPTTPFSNPWGYFDNNAKGVIGYGNLYTWSFSGDVYSIDLHTGTQNWSWNGGSAGIDTPYGIWPLGTWSMQHILADGKLYVRAGHDYTPPVFKGAKLYAINATTGEEIWNSLSFNIITSPCIADGVMVWHNGYDNQIYAYGKGPSKLTVDAPSIGVTTNTPITIKGTIIDISAGSQQEALAANFPNGLPCISDESQSQFMEAVYQEQPMPTNLTGVPIAINVVDSNGNYRTIGTAVSNAYGTYSLTWTPDIPGDYTVIANFAGSESYYPTEGATAFYAGEPAATPISQTATQQEPVMMYIALAAVAMIVAIAIATVVIVMVVRKRP